MVLHQLPSIRHPSCLYNRPGDFRGLIQPMAKWVKGTTTSAAQYFHRVNLDKVLYTDNFNVKDTCIGCGHCATICPAEAITMENDQPVWTKHRCFMCFGCLRLCPTHSIYYGDEESAQEEPLPCASHTDQPANAEQYSKEYNPLSRN